MKEEKWVIEDNKLVVYYETYKGKKGKTIFECYKSLPDVRDCTYSFRYKKYYLGSVRYCNLVKCYVPLYNKTRFRAFINCDLTKLK